MQMPNRLLKMVPVLLVACDLVPDCASAQLVTYSLNGTVGGVIPAAFETTIVAGQAISGEMTIDTGVVGESSAGTTNFRAAARLVLGIGAETWTVTDRLLVVDAPSSGGGCCGADHVSIDSGYDGAGPVFWDYVFHNVALAFAPASDYYGYISSSTMADGLKIIDSKPYSSIVFVYGNPITGASGQIRGAITLSAPSSVPVPASLLLLGSAVAGLMGARRRPSPRSPL